MENKLPKGWIETEIKQIGEAITGNTPSRKVKEYFGGSIPWIKPGDLTDSFINKFEESLTEAGAEKSRTLPPYSVMVSCIGNLGKVGYIDKVAATNQQINSIVFNEKLVVPKYGFYYSLTLKNWLYENSSATTVSIINKGKFEKAPFILPPLPEQQRIVAKLDTLFARLEKAKSRLEKIPVLLKNFRQAVLTQAVTGKLTEEWSSSNSFTQVEKTIERLEKIKKPSRYNSRNTSVIEGKHAISVGKPTIDIPKRYSWTELVSIASLETGHTPSRKFPEYWDGDLKWIGIKDAKEHHGSIIYETYQKPTQLGIDNSAARILPKGTVCFSRTASVGYVVLMGDNMATSQDFVNWICSDAVNPRWLQILLMAEKDSIISFGKGTTHTTIYFPEVISFHIALAPIEEQQEIVLRVESLFAKADAIEKQYEVLKQKIDVLPQALLAKAFKGELVEQLPTDGDAADLLKEIEKVKASLGKKKSSKKYKLKDNELDMVAES